MVGFPAGNNIGISISRGDLSSATKQRHHCAALATIELLVQTMLDNPAGRDGQPEIGMD